MQANQQNNIIQFAKLLLIGVAVKKVFDYLGVTKSDDEKAAEKAKQDQLDKEAKEALKKQNLTRPPSDFTSAADTIYNALKHSDWANDPEVAERAFLTVINNYADLAYLKSVYGSRELFSWNFSDGYKDLMNTIYARFAPWRIERSKSILAAKGVYI